MVVYEELEMSVLCGCLEKKKKKKKVYIYIGTFIFPHPP